MALRLTLAGSVAAGIGEDQAENPADREHSTTTDRQRQCRVVGARATAAATTVAALPGRGRRQQRNRKERCAENR